MQRKNLSLLVLSLSLVLVLVSILAACSQPAPSPTPTTTAPASSGASPKPSTTAPATTTATPKPTAQTYHIKFGSSNVGSGLYAGCVAIGEAVKKYFPNVQVTVQEAPGGAFENDTNVGKGTIDIGPGVSAMTTWMLTGTGMEEGHGAYPDIRSVFYYGQNAYVFMVTQASGVKTLADLTGKKYGYQGAAVFGGYVTQRFLDVAGVKPDLFAQPGVNQLADAVKNRIIIGFVQGTTHPSGIWIELNASQPLRLLDIPTDIQQAYIKKYPGEMYHFDLAANTYSGQDYPVNTMAWAADFVSNKNVPNWVIYDLLEATSKERQPIVTAMAGAKDMLKFEDFTLGLVNPPQMLHAGAVQWYKDHGFTVPANIIPPEYKDMPELKAGLPK